MSGRQSAVTLYYHLLSQPSRALKIFMDVNKIKYIPKEVQLAQGEHLQPEFEAINPFKKVPVISHNNFILTESVAILRYLCREFDVADHWYPKDTLQQAKVDEFLEWQHIELRAPLAMYFRTKFLMPMVTGKPAKQESVDRMYKLMVIGCDKVENIWLKDKPYLCGDSISIADILGACEIEQPRMAGYDPAEGRPKIKEWMDRIRKDLDPHYADAHAYLNAVAKKNAARSSQVVSKL
ncbi:glutathione S-transferase theta-1 [Nilaparvata lugens]|uniref:glutathione S-transferase theta-1 n=1 Tax=Nilaparvata lugens TaxID=108931 RepID=UPI00193E4ECA|nr:glutathione S-transferase theta-1 [Nilaparvata lugens]